MITSDVAAGRTAARCRFIAKPAAQAALLIAALTLFWGMNNRFVIAKSSVLMDPDSTLYYQSAQKFYDILTLNAHAGVIGAYETLFGQWKPPLYTLTAAPFMAYGKEVKVLIMSNMIYALILLCAVYGIGRKLHSHAAGLLAAFLVAMFPAVFAMSRVLFIETALTAMVATTFYFFLEDRFETLWFSVAAGLIIGLGLLTKQIYGYYLAGFVLFYLARHGIGGTERTRNLAITFCIAAAMAANWYVLVDGDHEGFLSAFSFNFFTYSTHSDGLFYVKSLLFRQLFPFYFALFMVSIAVFIRKKSYFMPVLVLVTIVMFSCIANRMDRHILPLFPFIAVMIAVTVLSWPSGVKRLAVPALIAVSIVQFHAINYQRDAFATDRFPLLREHNGRFNPDWGLYAIDTADAALAGDVERIASLIHSASNGSYSKVLLIDDWYRIHAHLKYVMLLRGYGMELFGHLTDFNVRSKTEEEFARLCSEQVNTADFVVVRHGTPADRMPRELMQRFLESKDRFSDAVTIGPFATYKRAER